MQKNKIKILHQTENEIVVFKPSGIATQLSDDVKGSSLESMLKEHLGVNELYFPHRLDRITSGLLLVALNSESIAFYNEQIKSINFQKYYVACIDNHNKEIGTLQGTHKRFLKVDGNKAVIVRSGGKPSFLDILCIEPTDNKKDRYNILVRLITGRMHQIRVMLADLGLPLTGDHIYNKKAGKKDRLNENFYLESIILKFSDMDGNDHTFFYKENPDRKDFSPNMNIMLEDIITY
ncbi:MAG: RNA pseudouridine synthase [Candidatus Delongbacteria bacterium]|nr:RNA pseudouridine synthase [Candidatus Delongbacteria bacterium]